MKVRLTTFIEFRRQFVASGSTYSGRAEIKRNIWWWFFPHSSNKFSTSVYNVRIMTRPTPRPQTACSLTSEKKHIELYDENNSTPRTLLKMRLRQNHVGRPSVKSSQNWCLRLGESKLPSSEVRTYCRAIDAHWLCQKKQTKKKRPQKPHSRFPIRPWNDNSSAVVTKHASSYPIFSSKVWSEAKAWFESVRRYSNLAQMLVRFCPGQRYYPSIIHCLCLFSRERNGQKLIIQSLDIDLDLDLRI